VSARHKARKAALDLLFSAEIRGQNLADALAELEQQASRQYERQSILAYATQLGRIVLNRQSEIDALISECLTDWTLERIPAVDRAILRVATAELLEVPDVPTAVVIAEAGELGSEFSTEQSRSFLQGVLGTVAAHARGESSEPGEA
jgi:N utilization substance protein B